MKTATKLILSVVLTAASSLAMAEGGSDRTLNRINETLLLACLKYRFLTRIRESIFDGFQ